MLLGAVLLIAAPIVSYLLSGDILIGIYAITLGAAYTLKLDTALGLWGSGTWERKRTIIQNIRGSI